MARTVRSVAEAESAAKEEDPITLPPDDQQKLAEAQEKAARELAEQGRQETLADSRGIRQQVREQMLRTERDWVVNVPEKDIEQEKTLGGD